MRGRRARARPASLLVKPCPIADKANSGYCTVFLRRGRECVFALDGQTQAIRARPAQSALVNSRAIFARRCGCDGADAAGAPTAVGLVRWSTTISRRRSRGNHHHKLLAVIMPFREIRRRVFERLACLARPLASSLQGLDQGRLGIYHLSMTRHTPCQFDDVIKRLCIFGAGYLEQIGRKA